MLNDTTYVALRWFNKNTLDFQFTAAVDYQLK